MKKMNLPMLTALVAGNMIGSGVFLLPSSLARLGSLSLISWFFTAIGAFVFALVFSRMGAIMPKTGGPYAYVQHGLGNFMGFQTAYSYWIAIWVGNASIALAGISYLSVFFPTLTDPVIACGASILCIWFFTFINLFGVRKVGIVQLIMTVLKLIPIVLIAILGWIYFKPDLIVDSINVTSPHISNFDLITHAATLILWAFIGLESATIPAEAVRNPRRNIPLATLFGTLIAAVVYITSSAAIMGMIPNETLQNSLSPFADAAEIIFGDWGKWIIAAGAVISCLGCLNGWILLQGQIPMAAARDGLFPKIFCQENRKKVPAKGLAITSILITGLLILTISPNLVTQFQVIILTATLATLIPYLYTPIIEILVIRKRDPLKIGALISAVIAIVYSYWAILGSGKDVLVYGAILLLSSVPLYVFTKRSKRDFKI